MKKEQIKYEINYIYTEVKNIEMKVHSKKINHNTAISELASQVKSIATVLNKVVDGL